MTTRQLPYAAPPGRWAGTAGFRLMPTDDLATAPSTLVVAEAATGRAVLLTYTWTHPADGPQGGTLVLGVPDDSGAVTAAWVDTWHQPDLTLLHGRGDDASASVGYEYAPGWHWEVEVHVAEGAVEVVMRNVVPERDHEPAVRYDVMWASWS